jgi:hypothetical protein
MRLAQRYLRDILIALMTPRMTAEAVPLTRAHSVGPALAGKPLSAYPAHSGLNHLGCKVGKCSRSQSANA